MRLRARLESDEAKQTYRAWVAEAIKKFAVDTLVLVLRTALGTLVAGGTALLGVSYAVSDKSTSVFQLPADIGDGFARIVDGMGILVAAASHYLATQ